MTLEEKLNCSFGVLHVTEQHQNTVRGLLSRIKKVDTNMYSHAVRVGLVASDSLLYMRMSSFDDARSGLFAGLLHESWRLSTIPNINKEEAILDVLKCHKLFYTADLLYYADIYQIGEIPKEMPISGINLQINKGENQEFVLKRYYERQQMISIALMIADEADILAISSKRPTRHEVLKNLKEKFSEHKEKISHMYFYGQLIPMDIYDNPYPDVEILKDHFAIHLARISRKSL